MASNNLGRLENFVFREVFPTYFPNMLIFRQIVWSSCFPIVFFDTAHQFRISCCRKAADRSHVAGKISAHLERLVSDAPKRSRVHVSHEEDFLLALPHLHFRLPSEGRKGHKVSGQLGAFTFTKLHPKATKIAGKALTHLVRKLSLCQQKCGGNWLPQ